MNKEQLKAFTQEAAKTLKTEQDLNDFRARLNNQSATRFYKLAAAGQSSTEY